MTTRTSRPRHLSAGRRKSSASLHLAARLARNSLFISLSCGTFTLLASFDAPLEQTSPTRPVECKRARPTGLHFSTLARRPIHWCGRTRDQRFRLPNDLLSLVCLIPLAQRSLSLASTHSGMCKLATMPHRPAARLGGVESELKLVQFPEVGHISLLVVRVSVSF